MVTKEQIVDYLERSSAEKYFWGRALVLIWSFVVFSYLWKNQEVPGILNPLWVVSHGIHEIGHWITIPFGQWVSVASGTLFELLFPILFIYSMLRSGDPHGASTLLTWVAATWLHSAHYAGSAEYSDLVMDTPHYITLYHDWVWMLSNLNAVHRARDIEDFFYVGSIFIILVSIFGQGLCLYYIWRSKQLSQS